jgi:hypothetical protein
MRWVWRGVTGGTLVLGWIFIFWQNNFRITTPVVIIALGYLAVVATISNLWRVGASAVAPEDDSPGAWTRPTGARGELEKEKKHLLKAIKEAEFDHAMGKLSKDDADELIRMYRARAIEVIKELDRMDAGSTGSAREQIKREVQARLAVEAKTSKKDKKKGGAAKAEDAKAAAKAEDAKAAARATADEDEADDSSETDDPADEPPPVDEPKQGSTEATS